MCPLYEATAPSATDKQKGQELLGSGGLIL